eukprot:2849015-Pyramimonas_sp.AAC.1
MGEKVNGLAVSVPTSGGRARGGRPRGSPALQDVVHQVAALGLLQVVLRLHHLHERWGRGVEEPELLVAVPQAVCVPRRALAAGVLQDHERAARVDLLENDVLVGGGEEGHGGVVPLGAVERIVVDLLRCQDCQVLRREVRHRGAHARPPRRRQEEVALVWHGGEEETDLGPATVQDGNAQTIGRVARPGLDSEFDAGGRVRSGHRQPHQGLLLKAGRQREAAVEEQHLAGGGRNAAEVRDEDHESVVLQLGQDGRDPTVIGRRPVGVQLSVGRELGVRQHGGHA